jgi:pimeloyl-ACP methyl ester carboxylesterase
VFAPIAQFARVCAYDRVDLGSSGKAPAVPTFAGSVETLHALLRAADEQPPYVLAGHSYGGALVRFYATRYPSEVAGLVLIDSTHEDQQRRFAEIMPETVAPAGPARSGIETIDPQGMADEMGRAPWHADIPLVVLTATPADRTDQRSQLLLELQQDLASRSPQSEFIVANNSGHFIQLDEPSLVIDAVRRVVRKLS